MNPAYDFSGQVALVTGAAAGMGLDTARAFAAAGAAVVLADVDEEALRAATENLAAAGHRALGVTCDVAEEAQVAGLVDRTVDRLGRLDMAINNAGVMPALSDAAEEPAESFDRVTAVNLRGVWACMKHELRQMRARGDPKQGTHHLPTARDVAAQLPLTLTFRDHNAVEKVAISSSATTTPRPSTASCASARWTAT